MVAENRLVLEGLSSRRMRKSLVQGVVPSDWLKANWGLWVDLSDSFGYLVVEGLQVQPLGERGDHI